MKIEYLPIKSAELKDKLFTLFENEVFHLTTEQGLNGIKESGFIKTNAEGDLMESTCCSGGSVGRNNEWVCVFDFRNIPDSKKDHVFDSFSIPFCRDKNLYLILKKEIFESLIIQESKFLKVKIGKPISEDELIKSKKIFIHYGESWYQGDISVEYIDRIICFNLI